MYFPSALITLQKNSNMTVKGNCKVGNILMIYIIQKFLNSIKRLISEYESEKWIKKVDIEFSRNNAWIESFFIDSVSSPSAVFCCVPLKYSFLDIFGCFLVYRLLSTKWIGKKHYRVIEYWSEVVLYPVLFGVWLILDFCTVLMLAVQLLQWTSGTHGINSATKF